MKLLRKIHVSPWAVLTAALFYFFLGASRLPALLLPVLLHELGHLAAMAALGMDVRRIDIELTGLCIRYESDGSVLADILAAACGPIAGIVYGLFAVRSAADWLHLSGEISLILSVFNLLPALPLDGGRMTAYTLRLLTGENKTQLAEALSLSAAVLVFVLGLRLLSLGGSPAVCTAGVWLLVCCRSSDN